MSACLLTWNPEKWTWHELPELAASIKRHGPQVKRWSSGVTKHKIDEGDRAFLLRQSEDPTGIIGSGTVVVPPYQAPHWNDEKRKEGQKANFVRVRFDALLVPNVDPILPRDLLREESGLSGVNWDTQASGTTISDDETELLEGIWQSHLNQAGFKFEESESENLAGTEEPDRVRRETVRIIRDSAHSRAVKEENNYECQICGETLRLANGDRYAEAHHVHPLGEGGEDTPANIMCVCPNHHVLLDYGAIPLDSEEVEGVGSKYIQHHNQKIFESEQEN